MDDDNLVPVFEEIPHLHVYINGEWVPIPPGYVNITRTPPGIPWYEEKAFRASGEVICDICGKEYWKHPQPAKDEVPTLVRACDGRLLKL